MLSEPIEKVGTREPAVLHMIDAWVQAAILVKRVRRFPLM